MKNEFFDYLEALYKLTPRLWENEVATRKYIVSILKKKNIHFAEELYEVVYPKWTNYSLKVDSKSLECLPCGFKSGTITQKDIIDCFIVDEATNPVFVYNKYCPALSTPVMYDTAALAIKPSDVSTILWAKNVEGILEVEKYTFTSGNILVGNTKNPEKILVCHYDSYWWGSCDNGTGTALLMTLADKIDLDKYLLLIWWSEEISMDTPYWCYGYREFEKKHSDILERCKEIIVFDSFGYKENTLIDNLDILKEGFLLTNERFIKKAKMYATPYQTLMDIYHSPIDTIDKINNLDFTKIMEIIQK